MIIGKHSIRRETMELTEAFVVLSKGIADCEKKLCQFCGKSTCDNCDIGEAISLMQNAEVIDIDPMLIPLDWRRRIHRAYDNAQ